MALLQVAAVLERSRMGRDIPSQMTILRLLLALEVVMAVRVPVAILRLMSRK